MKNIFLDKKISKLSKDNKVEMLQLFELITYLAANKEISLDEAYKYTSIIFNILKE